MTKTIVVPLDGSERAEAALAPAAWLAHGFGADIHLITTSFATDTSGEEEMLRRAATKLDGITVRREVIHHAFPAHGVLRVVEADDDPILCLSTRGRTGLGALVLGSVSDELVREATVPTVLVGPSYRGAQTTNRRQLVCVDSTDASDAVLPSAARFAVELGLETEVLMVVDNHQALSFSDEMSVRVKRAADTFREAGVPAAGVVRAGAHASDQIVEHALANGTALISMATNGASGLSPKALGHVTAEVVRRATAPILVVRIES